MRDRDGYYRGAQCAIVMYDCHSKLSLRGAEFWFKEIREKCGNIPIVVCANKVDIEGRQYHKQREEMQWLVSAKSNYNYEKPFLHLIRVLKSDENIAFTATGL
jgi:GTP-binding nuclear protein Ran